MQTGGSIGVRAIGALLPVLLLVGLVAFLWLEHREESELRAEAARERAALFADGELGPVVERCLQWWRDELGIYYPPSAVAWARNSLVAYFLEGDDSASWRPLHCDETGVRRAPRVVRPLVELLPAEAFAEPRRAFLDLWPVLEAIVATAPEPGLLGVELLTHPATGEVVSRRWRRGAEGAWAEVEPAGAPAFPGLLARSFAVVPGAAPAALATLPRHHWARQPYAAFGVVAAALPPGAGIASLRLSRDSIEVWIEHPTPAFDGDPPAPYGDLDFDEHGIASRAWWYPRHIPGFGCPTGRDLAEVRADHGAALHRAGLARAELAWYSCSPAYSDGRNGVWHFLPE